MATAKGLCSHAKGCGMLQISIRMRMDSYEIKIYCCRKAVIMLNYLPQAPLLPSLHPPSSIPFCCSAAWHVRGAAAAPLLGSVFYMPQWQLVLAARPSFSSQSSVPRPKSIHSYLWQTKSKSFMPFLGRRQLFFSQFYWQPAIRHQRLLESAKKGKPCSTAPTSNPLRAAKQRDPFYKNCVMLVLLHRSETIVCAQAERRRGRRLMEVYFVKILIACDAILAEMKNCQSNAYSYYLSSY